MALTYKENKPYGSTTKFLGEVLDRLQATPVLTA